MSKTNSIIKLNSSPIPNNCPLCGQPLDVASKKAMEKLEGQDTLVRFFTIFLNSDKERREQVVAIFEKVCETAGGKFNEQK